MSQLRNMQIDPSTPHPMLPTPTLTHRLTVPNRLLLAILVYLAGVWGCSPPFPRVAFHSLTRAPSLAARGRAATFRYARVSDYAYLVWVTGIILQCRCACTCLEFESGLCRACVNEYVCWALCAAIIVTHSPILILMRRLVDYGFVYSISCTQISE